jgi:hypothetical protein
VMSDGSVRTGPCLSTTVIWKLPVARFPARSSAEQATAVVPTRNDDPDAGVQLTARGPSTASFAEAANDTTAPDALVASVVMFAGSVSVGGAESRTVTVNVPEPVFPRVSEAVHVTVVVPIGNVEPDAGEHVGVIEPSTVSLAVAVKVTTAPDALVPT